MSLLREVLFTPLSKNNNRVRLHNFVVCAVNDTVMWRWHQQFVLEANSNLQRGYRIGGPASNLTRGAEQWLARQSSRFACLRLVCFLQSRYSTKGLTLFSIDGGGIRGLSELCILREIMNRLKYKLKLDELPIPAEYFDLIGGTSTGGYITVSIT